MTISSCITQSFVRKLKKEAKSRRAVVPARTLQQIQNDLAREYGFRHWNELCAQARNSHLDNSSQNNDLANYCERLPHMVMEKIVNAVDRDGHNIYVVSVPGQATPTWEEFVEQCWGVWKNGFYKDTASFDFRSVWFSGADIHRASESHIDKATTLEELAEASTWVALADYWSSIYGTLPFAEHHPSFLEYMPHWVEGMRQKNRWSKPTKQNVLFGELLGVLGAIYPAPEVNMIVPGTSNWNASLPPEGVFAS